MTQAARVESPLLEGPNIFTQVQHSHFKDFYQAFHTVKSFLPDEDYLTLPQLVVVGTNNAGKSSLLESITKCAIFPRHKKLCTKFPVRLRMKSAIDDEERGVKVTFDGESVTPSLADDVLETVTKMMNEARRLDDLNGQELVVEITQRHVPTFEFVDLPSLQTASPELLSQSRWLINPYLNQNTLILCVVDARSPLRDDAALAAIRDAGKLQNTIVVLTQADKLAPADREEMFDNILNTDSDCQDLDQLKGVVAVINRDHTDQISLVQAVDAEQSKFEAMVFEASGQYGSDSTKEALRQGMTTQKLLEKLDSLYSVHMQTKWVPAVLHQIHLASCSVTDEVQALGPAPDRFTPTRILQDLHSQVDFADICSKTDAAAARAMQLLPSYAAEDAASRVLLDWAAKVIDLETKATRAVDDALDVQLYLPIIRAAYARAFQANEQLARFDSMRERLSSVELPDRFSTIIAKARAPVYFIRDAALRELYNSAATGDVFAPLKSSVSNYLIVFIVKVLMAEPLQLSSEFQPGEMSEIEAQRTALQRKGDKLFNASVTLKDFYKPVTAAGPAPVPLTSSPAIMEPATASRISASAVAPVPDVLHMDLPKSPATPGAGGQQQGAFSTGFFEQDVASEDGFVGV